MPAVSGHVRRALAVAALAAVAAILVAGASAAREGAQYAVVKGTIRDATSRAPLAKACVIAYDVDANAYGAGPTGSAGTYSLSLPPGSYELQFYDCSTAGTHAPELYSGEDGLNDAAADPLTVTAAQTVTGVDATLRAGGTILVHTQTKAGAPIADVLVCPLFANDWAQDGYCYFTNTSGNATIAGIVPGLTRIEAIYSLSNYYELLYYPQTRGVWLGSKISLFSGAVAGPLTFSFNGPSSASAAGPKQRQRPIGAWAMVKGRATFVSLG